MNTLILIILAIVAPLLLAGAVGFPTWFAARWRAGFVNLRDDYRGAVGLVKFKPSYHSQGDQPLPIWMSYLILSHTICILIHPSLGGVFIGLGAGLWHVRKSLVTYGVFWKHRNAELRLRLIPIAEIVIWSVVSLLCFAFAILHLIIIFEGWGK